MIKLESLTYTYPKAKTPVFADFSLEVKPGSICGLLGSNGAGKSTLLYLMCGLLTPHAGTVSIDDQDARRRLPSTLSEIFLVAEDFTLPPVTLKEYVEINAPFYPRFDREKLTEILGEFHLDDNLHLGRLSMGQKKKVLIAFALACNTRYLLMDEPTNGLDIPGKSEFRRVIINAMTDDRAIVISTHQVRDLDRILDHLILISNRQAIINESIDSIQRRLAFTLEATPDPTAAYCEAVPGGYAIIRHNTDNADTDINLESFFNYCVNSK